VKLAVVVQRYGADINGGAELHARYVAEHLGRHAETEVLTTCARDYITWKNDLPPGEDRVHGVRVVRFPVSAERDPQMFGRRSARVFHERHSIADELRWLSSEGPTSPALVAHLRAAARQYDFFIFFSYRYYHSYHGMRAVQGRALLVPTAERDPAIGLGIFPPIFRAARAIMYNSSEERAMIHRVAANEDVPGVVVGIGSEIPERTEPMRFRQKFGVNGRFAIYVGRIDENKGCRELFQWFQAYARVTSGLSLVLVGNAVIPVPDHPRIRHVGFLDDQDKFDAIAASDLLIMPSPFESLSMVVLEAWALGRPVLVNAGCDVLQGQAIRSNAGLYYETHEEFVEALYRLETDGSLSAALGRNGRRYYRTHYAWPVIEGKYLDMLTRLTRDPEAAASHPVEPLPGWFARRRQTLRPAAMVLADIPAGPVRETGTQTSEDGRSGAGVRARP
jgi:glycosyltransferase involved in cell wall biosynthesis